MIPVEAIERVIDDFETHVDKLRWARELSLGIESACKAYEHAIQELRKVLSDYGCSK